MQEYDLCVLFSGEHTESEVDALAKKVDAQLAEASADVTFSYSLGRKKLAYTIAGNTQGEYRCWLFSAEPAHIPKLDEKLRLSSDILRHLLLKLEDTTIEARIEKVTATKERPQKEPNEEAASPAILQTKTVIGEKPPADGATTALESKNKKTTEKEEKKAGIENLDEKLDELLESDKL